MLINKLHSVYLGFKTLSLRGGGVRERGLTCTELDKVVDVFDKMGLEFA